LTKAFDAGTAIGYAMAAMNRNVNLNLLGLLRWRSGAVGF
jgi:hypothetical protein